MLFDRPFFPRLFQVRNCLGNSLCWLYALPATLTPSSHEAKAKKIYLQYFKAGWHYWQLHHSLIVVIKFMMLVNVVWCCVFRRDYERALHINPLCLPARTNLAHCLQVMGRFMQAWKQFKAAINIDSGKPSLTSPPPSCYKTKLSHFRVLDILLVWDSDVSWHCWDLECSVFFSSLIFGYDSPFAYIISQ